MQYIRIRFLTLLITLFSIIVCYYVLGISATTSIWASIALVAVFIEEVDFLCIKYFYSYITGDTED